jgi:hypothetical protein
MRLILSCTGVLAVEVTSFAGEGTSPRSPEESSVVEWSSMHECVRLRRPCYPCPPLSEKALDIPFYRHKGMVQLYIWGCCYVLTWPAKKCLSPVEA